MRKNLYCGVDLHSNNAVYVITDEQDQQLLRSRLPNELPVVLKTLAPFRARLQVVAVESTYNWYWLVDGLQEKEYPVVRAHPAEMEQYDGVKEADDLTDAAFLARLARLNILPTGYIYPKEDRPVRDLLRRRMLVVQHRTGIILSLENMAQRQTGQKIGWRSPAEAERRGAGGSAGGARLPGLRDGRAGGVDRAAHEEDQAVRAEGTGARATAAGVCVLANAAGSGDDPGAHHHAGDGRYWAVSDGRRLHVLLSLRAGDAHVERQEEGA